MVICPQAQAKADLLQVVHALRSLSARFGLGERGEQQAVQNGDGGNDHEQFDEREGTRS